MNNILIIGNLSYNINLFFNSSLIENQTITITKKTKSVGNTSSISIILSKYGLNVYYFSFVGNDLEGKEIINYLNINKINTNYINIINNFNTNKRYILRNTKNDSKTILSERVNNKYKLSKNISFVPDIIYSEDYNYGFIKKIKEDYKNAIIITKLSEITTEALNICTLSDYIILPLRYAQILSNTILDIRNKKTIINLYLKTKRLFSGKILIYIEEIGTLYEYNNVINIIPKMGNKNKVNKNSYDIFIATFIYSISMRFSIDKCVKLSTISKFLSDNNKQNLNMKEVLDIYEKNN